MGESTGRDATFAFVSLVQVFINFAKKQSDNLEQQEASPLGGGPTPLQRFVNLLKSRPANTELSALISEGPEELESDDDEGLISFEEERVRQWPLQQQKKIPQQNPNRMNKLPASVSNAVFPGRQQGELPNRDKASVQELRPEILPPQLRTWNTDRRNTNRV